MLSGLTLENFSKEVLLAYLSVIPNLGFSCLKGSLDVFEKTDVFY